MAGKSRAVFPNQIEIIFRLFTVGYYPCHSSLLLGHIRENWLQPISGYFTNHLLVLGLPVVICKKKWLKLTSGSQPWQHEEITKGTLKNPDSEATAQPNYIRISGVEPGIRIFQSSPRDPSVQPSLRTSER